MGMRCARRGRPVLLSFLPMEAVAATSPVRIMPLGDSVTGGGTSAADTYRYPLYEHYRDEAVAWQPVGPFVGVSYLGLEPAGWLQCMAGGMDH